MLSSVGKRWLYTWPTQHCFYLLKAMSTCGRCQYPLRVSHQDQKADNGGSACLSFVNQEDPRCMVSSDTVSQAPPKCSSYRSFPEIICMYLDLCLVEAPWVGPGGLYVSFLVTKYMEAPDT